MFKILFFIYSFIMLYAFPSVYANLTEYGDAVKTGVFDQQIKIDYSDEIYTDKKLSARLLYILDMMGSKPAKTTVVKGFNKSMQDDILASASSAHGTNNTAGAEVTIELANASMKNQITERATLELDYVPTTGFTNYVYVSSKDSSSGTNDDRKVKVKPIDPAKKVGKDASANFPASTLVNVTGTWFEQHAASVKPVSFFPTVVENYTQIERTGYEYSETAAQEDLYTKGTLKNGLMEDARRDHLLKQEKTLLFNGPKYKKDIAAQTDTVQIGYMQGLIYTVKTESPNVKSYDVGAWEYDLFDEWQFNLFDPELDDEVGKRLLICNKAMRKFFTDLKKEKPGIEIAPNDTYGIPGIQTVVTDYGSFDLMVHPRINARWPSKDNPFGLALHLDYMEYKPFRKTRLKTGIQNNDVDGAKDEFISEWTYLMYQPVYHGMIYSI